MSRCDLHVHSRASDRSEEWLFRRLDFPDSYSNPKDLYAALRAKGMDFVTITDHDTIEGGLQISELANTFLSEQITTYFPSDPCKIHLLVWGISEAQHAEIARLRENIFELQTYLQSTAITHAVAHPLYSINGKLETAHLERLILLFKHFEGLNGLRDALLSELAQGILAGLNPEKIDELANRHGRPATHPEPWRKILVGGSDDHGGLFLASAFTETPAAASAADFLAHIRTGKCTASGHGGSPLALSHGFYNTLSRFIQDHFNERLGPSAPLVEAMFSRFMEGRDPTEFSLRQKANFVAQGVMSGKIFDLAKRGNVSLWKELSGSFAQPEVKALLAQEAGSGSAPERRTFVMANVVCEQLAFRFFEKFVQQLSNGNVIESIQALSGIAPILVVLAPYIYGFHSQAPSRVWLRKICLELTGSIPKPLQNHKRAWFTDTLEDVNGVSTTVRRMAAAAAAAGEELVVVTSRGELTVADIPIKNFRPIGEFELPEYELQKLSFPPILQILDYVQREQITEIIISTPGPIGLTGLLAAKMLNLRTSGIYHTDFPEYIRILTEDSFLESLGWTYMRWFYGQLDTVFVNSEQYRRSWIERGIEPEKIQLLPRGLDTELFDPARRDTAFWRRFEGENGNIEHPTSNILHQTGSAHATAVTSMFDVSSSSFDQIRLLYVGRVSKEKDLDVLAAAYERLRGDGLPIKLFIVGDGPYAKALAEILPEAVFTGSLAGQELATAYASADLFVFPSTTDTFGNVIIEAQASGLPVIVSDLGGPKELVEHGVDGLVTRALDVEEFARAIATIASDPELRARMARRAREKVIDRSWPKAFQKFWAATAL
ncbi:MAG: glycosyltransferase [Chthoniobacterales bacterium]|nr:glycosyltransferase [Chthoniobacterales bacterium]